MNINLCMSIWFLLHNFMFLVRPNSDLTRQKRNRIWIQHLHPDPSADYLRRKKTVSLLMTALETSRLKSNSRPAFVKKMIEIFVMFLSLSFMLLALFLIILNICRKFAQAVRLIVQKYKICDLRNKTIQSI